MKNFQLVTTVDQESVILQFGRVGKDDFTMDYQWPLSPFQGKFFVTVVHSLEKISKSIVSARSVRDHVEQF